MSTDTTDLVGTVDANGRTQMNATNISPARPEPSRWAILALLGVAQLMVVLGANVVNVALPSAQRALHFTADNRQWIITAYALSFGSLLLVGGKLGDLFGRKWTLIGGLAGFALASAAPSRSTWSARAPRS
jgi:MFS family permease